jgi:hypothetical protein
MNHTTWGRALARPQCAAALIFATCSTLFLVAGPAHAAVTRATPSTLSSSMATAEAGDVVTLESGDYGTFRGASKSGPVTVRAAAGAEPTMEIDWSSAANVRVEGVTITGASIRGTTHDVTIANSRFTGMASVRADQMVNANILFDGNTHAGIDVCGSCYEGRLTVTGEGPGPAGVVVRNSVFGPGGNADGMQVGANGVQVLDNTFTGIRQVSAVHSDALQLYGQSNTVVRGNYFHDNDVAIMAPDGGENEQITDNVFIGGGDYRPAVQLGSHDNTVFAHNVVRNLDVFLDAKSDASPSRNSVARDNVLVDAALNVPSAKCSACTVTHNLFDRSSRATGAATVVGAPVFAGGGSPAGYAGHVLAAGSPGKGNASDGTDRGIRLQPGTSGPGAPPNGPAAPGTDGAVSRAKLKAPRRATWRQLRRGLRVRVVAGEPVRVVLRLSRKRNGKALARKVRRMPAGRRTFVLRVRPGRRPARKVVLMVRMTNRAGETSVLRRKIRVRR